ncbi:UBX domain-containing protein 11 isoform X2 [Symphalangus syndactylus]|uniref:UBX domain-containing protein 11 isoform X2 n=1 Tax=Symphalangus syndactylus TaxID=9590 RepID=UPI0024412923|nr:UBX domain-containing protein 11 isoform X1 [Symphalangus syndactylus]XP_055117064.1 UBX domain-containing protein 11 isoform X1 [Symphalangus syndactylus]XP_055117065.1 UBX domain-containing protein 11 isoform X1 [Symphalangus syndactylus]XP_055117066.1 UBX domain-containing protein 11 isoform X1 [Symphalangus syndactylus]
MSSPLASLSKTRKVPLPSEPVNPGRRGIRIYGDEDEVDMLSDGRGSEEKISVPSCYGGIGAPVSLQVPASHDSELMASMTRKLWDLEQQVKAQTDEILSKVGLQDRKIAALEDLVQTLRPHPAKATLQRQEELETMCVQLQRQVREMERFLSDYDLQWVGEPMDQEDSESKTVSEDGERDWMTAKKFWKPGDSLAPPEVDFDRLLASLQDLSELVVEGDTQVTPVPGGAQLRTLEPIPLKLYRNGIMMFDGPFQPFYDPSTQRCLRDILDGFFPSELQRVYPNGVPFKVSDLRSQVYLEDGLDPFPGEGRAVGRQRMHKALDRVEEHPGSRMTAEKFLNRLPKFVIRKGEVIDIRGPIRDTLQNCCPLPARIQEIVVETPTLAAERERSRESPNTPAPRLSMLRIKSENGEQAFLLMMQPDNTIGDVRALLAQARAMDASAFEIFSTFPPTLYQDDALTLQAAGLVPKAALLLRARQAPKSSPNFSPGPSPGPGPSPSPGPQ